MIKTLIHYYSSLVNHTRFQTKIGSLYPFSDQNAAKTQTFSKSVSGFWCKRPCPPLALTQSTCGKSAKKPYRLGRHNWAAYSYMSYIREYHPPPGGRGGTYNFAGTKITL